MIRRAFLAAGMTAPLLPVLAPAGAHQPGRAQRISPAVDSSAGYFTNALLTTHLEERVRFYDDLLKDKVVMINFMYTGCGDICPGMTQNLAYVQELLGDRVGRDIFMYSITLQPELDTAAVLREYAETFKVGPGWLFLTGAPPIVEMLRRRLGFVDSDPVLDADLEQHIGVVRYGNERLNRWSACPALSSPQVIVDAVLRTLPKHAG
jgi:protein SCO1/2